MTRELKQKNTSLLFHFTAWFIIIGVLPLVLFGYLSLKQYEADLRKSALTRISQLADKKTQQIKSYLNERVQNMELFAQSTMAEMAMQNIGDAYARYGFRSAQYLNTAKLLDRNFAPYFGEGSDALIYDAFLITPGGEVVYTYKHEPDFATNLISGPWRNTQLSQVFRVSRMTLEPHISDIELYGPSNSLAIFLGAPVIREGKLLGVAVFQLDTRHIYQVAMDSVGLGATGDTRLAKLFGPDEAKFVAPLRGDPEAALQRKIDLKAKEVAVPLLRGLAGERDSGIEPDYTGRMIVAAWRYLPELRWAVVVKEDAEEVFAPLYQKRKELLGILLGLMLFILFAAVSFGRWLIEPIKQLALTAQGIAGGNLGWRIDVNRTDEIGVLGRAFNRMAESLQALYRTQEERIEERTRELNVSNEQLREEIIEREEYEQALQLYKSVIDIYQDGFWVVDGRGYLLMVNQAAADISGYSREEMAGMHISQLEAIEKTPGDVKAHMEKIIAKGFDLFETRHRHKDGHEIDIEVTTTYLPRRQQFAAFIRDISGRKRAEEALRLSEERLSFALQGANDGLWDWNLETNEVYYSSRWLEMLGYLPDELPQALDTWAMLVHPEDKDRAIAFVREYISGNIPAYEIEFRMRHKHGYWLDILSRARLACDETGQLLRPRRLVGTHVDISERKRTQIELQHKQELLNEAQRLGKMGSWELDLASGKMIWSDETYRVFELNPSQILPLFESFLGAICPDDRARVKLAHAQSLEKRQSYDVVYRLQMADGRIKWVRGHCKTYFDAFGKALRSVGVMQDITAQKLAEDRLRIAAVAFETDEAIMITDAHSNIVSVNKAFTRITGYEPEEVLGKNPRILSSGRMDMAFYAQMWKELLQNGSWSGEIWDRRKSGEIYPKWLTITAVKNEEGDITEFVAMFSDITARKEAEDEIRNLAFYDVLTGLPNRRLLLDRFDLALLLSERSQHYGAVLFLDMDKFKTLNDTLGHDYGDLLLLEVAKRIQSCVREADTVARLGGDEFVVLIEEISASQEDALQKVAIVAEKIRLSLSDPYRLKEHEYHSSPSIGVCMFHGSKEPVDDLLKHADLAMYQAKESGRNAVRFFDPDMQQVVEARAMLERDLRHAIASNELILYYQIQVDSDIRPVGAEALLRWKHPVRGMVSPAQFIPVAEDSALILEIGQWVLDTACRQLEVWSKREQTRDLELAINVSARQFGQHGFVQQVENAVRKHGVASGRLKLELTESVVLKDVADVVTKMHALKAAGIKLSLDDFGTGYSSLFYLKKLPLDQIKIDQRFVRGVTSDPNDAAMVKVIIDLAQNFHLNVIAEGVETAEQLTFLRKNGCMAYQGYLFGKPAPVSKFETVMQGLHE